MKKIVFCLCLVFAAAMVKAQNGLESLVVEKYYVSNAADSAGSQGLLPVGSFTYRIYADMLPGYKFQAVYGVPGHLMKIVTTTSFFNNEDRGSTTPNFTKAQAANNTVMLDSWFSVGGAATNSFGIIKSEDDGVANTVNANGLLQNNNPLAGIPLTTQDGFIAGTPQSVTFVGLNAAALSVFNATSQVGNLFSSSNGSVASLNGSTGPTAANKVLIAQITTNGCLSYELNIQIGTPLGGIQNFVAKNPVGNEIVIPSMVFPQPVDVSISASPTGIICTGTNVTFTATPISGGTTPAYQWRKNGSNVGTNSATYASNTLVTNDQISCILTSSDVCQSPVTDTSNTIVINTISQSPTIASFSPGTGTIGTIVTINGAGFTGTTSVKFNGVSAVSFTVVNANQITATVPPGATSGKINLVNTCGSVLSTTSFIILGLENIILEKYYISNSADSINSVGTLPVGSVTYRIYADLLPGYKFQAAYGVPGHTMSIATSTSFFNNEDRGATTPTFTKAQAANNTVMLDSWVSVGAGCASNFGILKSEDNGVANVVNANGILQNNNAAAGIPLTTQDGLIAGSPEAVTLVGITPQLSVFNQTSQAGNLFTTANGSWASLNGSTGPNANNKVLIAQITTEGCLSYQLNIQIGTPGGGVQNYVANNPVGSEIVIPTLTYPHAGTSTASVSITSNPSVGVCPGTPVTFSAMPVNGGTSPVYQWKKNGINVGVNSSTYIDSTLANNDQIKVTLTSNIPCIIGSPATSNIISANVISCGVTLNVKVFLEGFYIPGTGTMMAVVDPANLPNICDTISVSLADSATLQEVQILHNVISITGQGSFTFTAITPGNSYYVIIRHRNAIETWSKYSFVFNTPTKSIDFTAAP